MKILNLISKISKLVTVPIELSKIRDIVKHDVVKKEVYNAKIKNIANKIPDITNSATNASLNAKLNEVKGKIPSTTNLVTTSGIDAKISEIRV